MRRRWAHSFAAAIATFAASAHGHHSIASAYDSQRHVTVEGTVVEFHFVNPHPVLVIDVVTESGATLPWRLEMDNRSELAQIGIDARTFKPGDRVIASGSAARTEEQALYLLRLDRPADGLRYEQLGYRPRLDRRPPR